MSDKIYTIEEIKQIVAPIASAHGITRMYLFGSYARGEATPTSDLDFRIDKGNIKGLLALGSLYADLEEAINVPIDLLTTESLDSEFISKIKSEEVLIYVA